MSPLAAGVLLMIVVLVACVFVTVCWPVAYVAFRSLLARFDA